MTTSTTTGIELAPDSCVLVKVQRGAGPPRLSAVHVVEPSAWPAQDHAVSGMLAQVRRRKRLDRHAYVVSWAVPESASPSDPATLAALRPLLQAGFIVDAVATLPRALSVLAAERARPVTGAATAWLALARHGAAIAILRGTEVLYSRTLEWRYKPALRLNEQLLQRYSLVSHLAPELRKGIEVVAAEHGLSTDCAITCGNLPDLRSLTMPLIEELDLEVETLDSLDGLDVTVAAQVDRALEYAPALRLACAVTALPASPAPRSGRPWVPIAAGLGAAALGWWGLSGFPLPFLTGPGRVPATIPEKVPAAASPADSRAEPEKTEKAETRTIPQASTQRQPPASSPADTARTDDPRKKVPATRPARPAPLPDRLPTLNSILLSAERRLAVLDGAIVREGDTVGRRQVLKIEQEAVVLREPSGLEVRIRFRR